MDVQEFVWIVGHGPVLVHRQFCIDIVRQLRVSLNGHRLSPDLYCAVQRIYETCGVHYYQYTKWLNQSMGNFMVEQVQRAFGDHCVVPEQQTYQLHAHYKEGVPNRCYIHAAVWMRVLDVVTLNLLHRIRVTSRRSLSTDTCTVCICYDFLCCTPT